MKILFSILLNALILLFISFLLWPNTSMGIESGVLLACGNCGLFSIEAWKIFLTWWIVLGLMNISIRPLLKILSLPLALLFLWFSTFLINGIILKLFTYIVNDILQIQGVSYTIVWWVNFLIAVAIFTFFNMLFSLLFSKR